MKRTFNIMPDEEAISQLSITELGVLLQHTRELYTQVKHFPDLHPLYELDTMKQATATQHDPQAINRWYLEEISIKLMYNLSRKLEAIFPVDETTREFIIES